MSGAGTGSYNLMGLDLPTKERETREQVRARLEAKVARDRSRSPWARREALAAAAAAAGLEQTAPRSRAARTYPDAVAVVKDYLAGMTVRAIAEARGHSTGAVRNVLRRTEGLVMRDDRPHAR